MARLPIQLVNCVNTIEWQERYGFVSESIYNRWKSLKPFTELIRENQGRLPQLDLDKISMDLCFFEIDEFEEDDYDRFTVTKSDPSEVGA